MLIFFLILSMETTSESQTETKFIIFLELLIFLFSFFQNGVICLLILNARVSQHNQAKELSLTECPPYFSWLLSLAGPADQ